MRVLLLPAGAEDVLAHVGTCTAIGSELAVRGHEAMVGYEGKFADQIRRAGLTLEAARTSRKRPTGPGSLGRMYRDGRELAELARQDVQTIEGLAPDVVVVDTRATAQLACELVGVPYVSIAHSLATGVWYREPAPWRRRIRWVTRPQRAPSFVVRKLRDDPSGLRAYIRKYHEARQHLGLPLGQEFVGGDAVACLTTPLLDPAPGLPRSWHYVGPVTWSADGGVSIPERRSRQLVYVTQGSTGAAETLRRAVSELRGEDLDVVVTTAGLCETSELESLAPNVSAARLLPGDELMARADAAVAHGGNLTMLSAHRAGTPVVVLPHDYDQWLWADRVERLGTGISLRPPLLPGAIRRAVRRLLRRDRYRLAAAEVAAHLRDWNGPARTADLVEELIGR